MCRNAGAVFNNSHYPGHKRCVRMQQTQTNNLGPTAACAHSKDNTNDCCRVHHPRLNEAVEAIRRVVRRLCIIPYSERSGKGELRYLQVTAIGTQLRAPAAQRDPHALVQVSAAVVRIPSLVIPAGRASTLAL